MSAFKNNPKFNLYYSDTDSIVIDQELGPKAVGDKLGQFKLEHSISRAAFLAPKVYAFKTSEGKEVIKVKGLTKEAVNTQLSFELMKTLLHKDQSLLLNQFKSNRNFSENTIEILNQTYNLIPQTGINL